GDRGGGDADQQAQLQADQGAGEQVAAQPVGAEPGVGRGSLAPVGEGRRTGGPLGPDAGEQHADHDEGEGDRDPQRAPTGAVLAAVLDRHLLGTHRAPSSTSSTRGSTRACTRSPTRLPAKTKSAIASETPISSGMSWRSAAVVIAWPRPG